MSRYTEGAGQAAEIDTASTFEVVVASHTSDFILINGPALPITTLSYRFLPRVSIG